MVFRFPEKNSLRRRVTFQVAGVLSIAILAVMLLVASLTSYYLQSQVYEKLQARAFSIQQSMEQRLGYLIESSILLSQNELMVGAFIDPNTRQTLLPPLIENFSRGKGVVSLSVVDYDGDSIFSTQQQQSRFVFLSELRSALSMNQVSMAVQSSDQKVYLIVPIEYYATTQGALIVEFDLKSIVLSGLKEENGLYVKLLKNGSLVYSERFDDTIHYFSLMLTGESTAPYLTRLGLALEIGLSDQDYFAPLWHMMTRFLLVGLLLMFAGVLVALMLSDKVTQPILQLYHAILSDSAIPEHKVSKDFYNVTEIKALAEAFEQRTALLQHQAQYDTLTQLPNRDSLMATLSRLIHYSQESKAEFAILLVDLDRFKDVNDSLGHSIGDRLLIEVTAKLQSILSEQETLARLSGDEFVILVEDFDEETLVLNRIPSIMAQFQQAIRLEQHEIYISCSIGIAFFPHNGSTPEILLKNADAAMHRAKMEGRNTYQLYTADMTHKAYERVMLEAQLRQAIAQEQLEVYYQPQVMMADEKMIGTETLVRWQHPELGMIMPGTFIPLAEETGLIVEIDRYVAKTALQQYVSWIKAGLDPGTVSLNASWIELNRSDFFSYLKQTIEESGLSAHHILLEVTETQIMRNPEQSIKLLQQVQQMGIRIAVDDFGTGHSSLSYLKRLPIDKIKIDQSFVRDIPEDKDDMALTNTIIVLAKSLNLELIAEGVETAEQADFLMAHGCDEAQGYLYYRPQPADKLTEILNRRKSYLS